VAVLLVVAARGRLGRFARDVWQRPAHGLRAPDPAPRRRLGRPEKVGGRLLHRRAVRAHRHRLGRRRPPVVLALAAPQAAADPRQVVGGVQHQVEGQRRRAEAHRHQVHADVRDVEGAPHRQLRELRRVGQHVRHLGRLPRLPPAAVPRGGGGHRQQPLVPELVLGRQGAEVLAPLLRAVGHHRRGHGEVDGAAVLDGPVVALHLGAGGQLHLKAEEAMEGEEEHPAARHHLAAS